MGRLKWLGFFTGMAITGYFGGRMALDPAYRNDITYVFRSTPIREGFNRQFQFPLKGFTQDIEDKQEQVSAIASAVARDEFTSDYRPASIRIEAQDPDRKGILDLLVGDD